jgi:hypothetical protein
MKNSIETEEPIVSDPGVRKPYSKPILLKAGCLAELTEGFSGSVPDEQGGHTKRNPFQG